MKKILQIANFLSLIITIFINYISNTGAIAGKTIADVSDKNVNLFTPAGYAFIIWGVIYLGLLGFVIYTGRSLFSKKTDNDDSVEKIGWWFVISCIANSLWVIVWLQQELLISVVIMIVALFSLLKIIVNLNMEMDFHPLKKYLLIYWPFAIYAGWLSVALIADVSAWLTSIGWNGLGISSETWAILLYAVAMLVNVLVIWKRNLREFGAVGVWALIAVGVANKTNSTLYYCAILFATIIFINIVIHTARSKGRNADRM